MEFLKGMLALVALVLLARVVGPVLPWPAVRVALVVAHLALDYRVLLADLVYRELDRLVAVRVVVVVPLLVREAPVSVVAALLVPAAAWLFALFPWLLVLATVPSPVAVGRAVVVLASVMG